MKKSTAIVLLVLALFFIAAGVILGVTEGFTPGRTEDALHSRDCTQIQACVDDVELCFYAISGDTLDVEIYDTNRVALDTDNGVLTITQRGETLWDRLRFFRRSRGRVVVWVPEGQIRAITVESGSGDVTASGLPEGSAAVKITTGSGEVSVYDCTLSALTVSTGSGGIWAGELTVREEMNIRVSSGSISLSDTRAGRAELTSASGDVWLGVMDAGEALTVKTASGEVSVSQCSAKTALLQTTSGGVWAEELTGEESLGVSATSGNVTLTLPETEDLRIETTSGDVWCSLPGAREDYEISAETGSGTVSGVRGDSGAGTKKVSVTTTSGDVLLEYAN